MDRRDFLRQATLVAATALLALGHAGMAEVFPKVTDQYEGGTSTCWDEDEWSRGAYAWFKPGQTTTLVPFVSGAEGRVHFAGEHASSQPGWMEGALESAERVVAGIARGA